MPKLPVIKPREVISVLKKKGFFLARTDGGHHRYHHANGRKVTVPYHNKPLKKGTFKSILRQANLSTEEFIESL